MDLSNSLWIVAFLLIFVWYLSNVAGRLDRLHLKAEAARLSLDTQLAFRTSATGRLIEKLKSQKIVVSDLDEILLKVIHFEVEVADDQTQWQLEGELTDQLNELFDQKPDLITNAELTRIITDLAAACRRVQFARAFHNDAQRNALLVRKRPFVKIFRLAGRAKMPELIEFNDQIPPGLLNK